MRKRVRLAGLWAGVLAAAAAAAVAQQGGPAAQAAVMPGVVATSEVQNLINTVRGEAGTYAGLWIDRASGTVYVSAARAGVTAGTVEALTPRAVSGEATMRLVVVHARYDFAQLEAIDARVIHDRGLLSAARAAHATMSEWYPDPVTDKVVIAFTRVTAGERAEVRAEYGTTARVTTAPVFYSSVGTAANMPKGLRRIRPDDRFGDSPPWFGGDAISANGSTCTSGYDWNGDSMTTAGHCGNTTFTAHEATGGDAVVGSTFTVQWGNGRIDMQRMNGSSYAPSIWAGANGDTPEGVSGSGGVAIGGTYCTSGAATGQNCSAVVHAIDVCAVLSGVNVCDLDDATSSNGTHISLPGDSGGPVFVSSSIYAPYAVGTISGANSSGTEALWSDMYMEKVIFGGGPALGTAGP